MLRIPMKLLGLAPVLAAAAVAPAQTDALPLLPVQAAPRAQQGPSQEQLIKLRDEKLAKAVFRKATWVTDYDAALAAAKQSGKKVFGYFTRSYAY